MNFCKKIIIAILLALLFSACSVNDSNDLSAEELLMADMDFLVTEIQTMYDEADADYLYEPFLYIAFADIDFDGIPEFFYGYQTMTGSHNKVWYRAYSLSAHVIIDSKHPLNWSTYLDDKACVFFTGPQNFTEGYFLNDEAEPCFVAKAISGPVTDIRTDYVFIKYTNSELSVNTGFECDKELLSIKQVWSIANIHALEDDIVDLLKEYSDLS